MNDSFFRIVASPVGPLTVIARGSAITHVRFAEAKDGRKAEELASEGSLPILDHAERELLEWFRGERETFTFAISPTGTPFQLSVWKQLEAIPFGETRTYGEIARAVGRPAASRAVGAANGMNPLGIVVPCHRVIGADGSLTGFGGGIDCKRWLLAWEQTRKPGAQLQIGIALSAESAT